jgi:hypothetical protein
MDIFVRLFRICVVLYVGSGVATGWSPLHVVLPIVYGVQKLKGAAKAHQWAIEPLILIEQLKCLNYKLCHRNLCIEKYLNSV